MKWASLFFWASIVLGARSTCGLETQSTRIVEVRKQMDNDIIYTYGFRTEECLPSNRGKSLKVFVDQERHRLIELTYDSSDCDSTAVSFDFHTLNSTDSCFAARDIDPTKVSFFSRLLEMDGISWRVISDIPVEYPLENSMLTSYWGGTNRTVMYHLFRYSPHCIFNPFNVSYFSVMSCNPGE